MTLKDAGFTLVELLVSVAIFAVMTALLVAKYGNFNQSVLLTDLAYDVALTIRTAQTYGLSVKGATAANPSGCTDFQCSYGVYFDSSIDNNSLISLLAVKNDSVVGTVATYSIKRGAIVSNLKACTNQSDPSTCQTLIFLDILFKRPDFRLVLFLGFQRFALEVGAQQFLRGHFIEGLFLANEIDIGLVF